MNLQSSREKPIEEIFSDKANATGDKVRVTVQGQPESLITCRVPLKYLIFNIRNGRFASELLAKEEELKRKLDATVPDDALIIRKLLLEQDASETKVLTDDIKKHGQLEPGIITFDGAVINANRRMAILSQLYEDTRDEKYAYLIVGRLKKGVGHKDLWRIEAGLQFAKDFRLEYGAVNELLKLKEGRDQGLSEKDISISLLGRYSEKKVQEKLAVLSLMETYLEFIGKPGEYHRIQEEQLVEKFNSLQSSVVSALQRQKKKPKEIQDMVTASFLMINKTKLSHWNIREVGKIANDKRAREELLVILDPKKPLQVSAEKVQEAFTSANEIVEDKEEQDKPERLLKRALSAVSSINPKSPKLRDPGVLSLLNDLSEQLAILSKANKSKK